MKAKFRKTGEIVDIISYSGNTNRNDVLDSVSYIDSKGVEHPREKLNFYWDFESIQETSIAPNTDWQQVKIQAAIGAMQAQLANPELLECVTSYDLIDGNASERVAKMAVKYARALVEELKKDVNV